jgi:hypothetical protein
MNPQGWVLGQIYNTQQLTNNLSGFPNHTKILISILFSPSTCTTQRNEPIYLPCSPSGCSISLQGSNATSKEISMLETTRIINCEQFNQNYHQSHAHMNPFQPEMIINSSQPSHNGSSPPSICFRAPTKST